METEDEQRYAFEVALKDDHERIRAALEIWKKLVEDDQERPTP